VGCSRGGDLTTDDAIEILVLDGVPRDQASCIVAQIGDAVSLEKLTGVDPTLEDEHIEVITAASAACSIRPDGDIGGVIGGDQIAYEIERLNADVETIIQARIDELVTGGLDPIAAECLRMAALGEDDPLEAASNLDFLSDVLVIGQGD
jgi:hypothetical protein